MVTKHNFEGYNKLLSLGENGKDPKSLIRRVIQTQLNKSMKRYIHLTSNQRHANDSSENGKNERKCNWFSSSSLITKIFISLFIFPLNVVQ